MAPFKEFVLSGIDKIKDIDIDMIAAGHGPVLDSGIDEIVETYRHLASVPVKPDKKMIVVAYGSAYGYTRALKDAVIGAVIVSDNVLLKGATASNEYDPSGRYKTSIRRMRNYLKHITCLDGIYTSVIPAGDGITVSVLQGD